MPEYPTVGGLVNPGKARTDRVQDEIMSADDDNKNAEVANYARELAADAHERVLKAKPAGALINAVVQANADGTWPNITRVDGFCYEAVGPWHPDGTDAGKAAATWWGASDSDSFTRTAT